MCKIFRKFVCLLLSLSLFFLLSCQSFALEISPLDLENYPIYETISPSAKACIVMEASTGRILCGKNIHTRLPQASTTKIIGALMVLEQENLDEYFTVDPDAIHVEGSSMGLREGDKVSLYSLACGMILPSGNDAANAAGVRLFGSVEKFVDAMNQRAQELELNDTHYVTACGLDAPEHYSSAFDLAKLTRTALQNPLFADICKQSTMKVKFGNPPYERWLKNYNRLLKLYPNCIGVKTGFTDDAGRCLVSAAEKDGMTLICVTLNAQDDWNLHKNLYESCFRQFSMQKLPFSPTRIPLVGDALQENGCESEIELTPAVDMLVPLRSGESSRLCQVVLKEPFCYAPSKENTRYAELVYQLDRTEFCSVPLVLKK